MYRSTKSDGGATIRLCTRGCETCISSRGWKKLSISTAVVAPTSHNSCETALRRICVHNPDCLLTRNCSRVLYSYKHCGGTRAKNFVRYSGKMYFHFAECAEMLVEEHSHSARFPCFLFFAPAFSIYGYVH